MEESTEKIGSYAYGRIVQVNNVHIYIIKYRIVYDTRKAVGDRIDFGDLCT